MKGRTSSPRGSVAEQLEEKDAIRNRLTQDRLKSRVVSVSYHEVSDDHGQEEERNAVEAGAVDAVPHGLTRGIHRAADPDRVPHGLDPLAAEDAEDDHERVEEVDEVPARLVAEHLLAVVGAEQLHAHDGKDEDDDHQHEAEVAERAHRPPDDADEQVERRPRLGQLEHSQLRCIFIFGYRKW